MQLQNINGLRVASYLDYKETLLVCALASVETVTSCEGWLRESISRSYGSRISSNNWMLNVNGSLDVWILTR